MSDNTVLLSDNTVLLSDNIFCTTDASVLLVNKKVLKIASRNFAISEGQQVFPLDMNYKNFNIFLILSYWINLFFFSTMNTYLNTNVCVSVLCADQVLGSLHPLRLPALSHVRHDELGLLLRTPGRYS